MDEQGKIDNEVGSSLNPIDIASPKKRGKRKATRTVANGNAKKGKPSFTVEQVYLSWLHAPILVVLKCNASSEGRRIATCHHSGAKVGVDENSWPSAEISPKEIRQS